MKETIIFSSSAVGETIQSNLTPNYDGINDVVITGDSNDTIFIDKDSFVKAGNGNDTINSVRGRGNNTIYGEQGNDRFFLGSNNFAIGGEGDDRFFTFGGGNVLSGGIGADQFWVVNGKITPTQQLNVISDYNFAEGDAIGIGMANILVTDVVVTQSVEMPKDAIVSVLGNEVAIIADVNANSLSAIDGTPLGFENSVLIVANATPII